MTRVTKLIADRRQAAAPHHAPGVEVSTVQPPQQAVILLPIDEFLHMKEELISEVRALGAGNVVATGSSMKEVMTPQEAAEVLGISVKHLMELRRAKKLLALRMAASFVSTALTFLIILKITQKNTK